MSSSSPQSTSFLPPSSTASASGMKNTALVFVKPHGHTPQLIEYVKHALTTFGSVNVNVNDGSAEEANKNQSQNRKGSDGIIRIVQEGTLDGPTISANSTIDRHYAAIGLYAMALPAKELVRLVFTDAVTAAFTEKYGITPEEALRQGLLVNAAECMRQFHWEGLRVASEFDKSKSSGDMLKIAPGCYVGRSPFNGAIIVNGFYLSMRAEYVKPKARVTWLVVEWDESALCWADFRAKVLGATDPAKAAPGSIRANILAKAAALGLHYTPTMGSNCVHGSASPLEALNERMVWTSSSSASSSSSSSASSTDFIAADTYGAYLMKAKGLSPDAILSYMKNAKVVASSSVGGNGGGGVRPIFDVVEDTNSSVCADTLAQLSSKL